MRAYRSIILSGTPVSGKSSIAVQLSKKYGWPVYSLGGLWRDKYKKLHPDGDITFEEFWGRTTGEDSREINEQAKKIFEDGGMIGDSRYVPYLDGSVCLLVFVTADINIRVQRSSNRDEYKGMPMQEIKRVLEKRERDELRIGQELFGIDYRNPEQYHVVINSGMMTVEQEVSVIEGLMEADKSE